MNTKEIAEMIKKMTPQEREELSKELEEKKRVFSRWKPEKDELYWWINEIGETSYSTWDNCGFDNYQYKRGNCYQTDGLAEEASTKQEAKDKLLTEIREYMDEIGCEEPVWDGCTGNTWLFCASVGVDEYQWVFEMCAHKIPSPIPQFKYNVQQCLLILDKFKDRLDILLEDN